MGKTVLVVENDKEIRRLIADSLLDAKYSVVKAADSKSAMEGFHEFKPDIAVVDVEQDDIDGLELCRQMRSFRNIPVIFLNGDESELEQLQEIGRAHV